MSSTGNLAYLCNPDDNTIFNHNSNMIIPILGHLSNKNILLVSKSPRRVVALKQLGLIFNVSPSTFAEDLDVTRFPTPADYAKETALEKSSLFVRKPELHAISLDLVIAADTIVVLDDEIIGQPNDRDEAKRTLERLSGRTHKVITGVALVTYERKEDTPTKIHERVFHEETEVTFATLPPEVIEVYSRTREPMDKAGAYGIQGVGSSFIEGIKGDYFNVVGFPIHHFCREVVKLHNDNLL